MREMSVVYAQFSHYTFHVFFTDDIKACGMALQKAGRIRGAEAIDANTDAIQQSAGCHGFILYDEGVSVGTIAHEAWHGVYDMLKHIGAELDNEVVAYCLGYAVDQIVDFKIQKRRAACRPLKSPSPRLTTMSESNSEKKSEMPK